LCSSSSSRPIGSRSMRACAYTRAAVAIRAHRRARAVGTGMHTSSRKRLAAADRSQPAPAAGTEPTVLMVDATCRRQTTDCTALGKAAAGSDSARTAYRPTSPKEACASAPGDGRGGEGRGFRP
jgi:hypothetical protein